MYQTGGSKEAIVGRVTLNYEESRECRLRHKSHGVQNRELFCCTVYTLHDGPGTLDKRQGEHEDLDGARGKIDYNLGLSFTLLLCLPGKL